MDPVKPNSIKAWFLAARPKTLTGAAIPVIIGLSLAIVDGFSTFPISFWGQIFPAVLCLLFALIMQVDANFINDYYDCIKGTDREDRLGPKRACSEGWITLDKMKKGIATTTVVACLIGLPLIAWGGIWMIFIGLFCVVFAFLYTYYFSYKGAGDILVLIFFGFIPTCIPYYLELKTMTWECLLAGLVIGLVTDNLLMINNFRDRVQDKESGKMTLVVRLGEDWGKYLYLGIGVLATLLCLAFFLSGKWEAALFPWAYLLIHFSTWKKMVRINQGKQLNIILGESARNILIFGALLSLGFLVSLLHY